MVFTLETIVEKFGEEMAPFAVGLCQHLSQAFWRLQVRPNGSPWKFLSMPDLTAPRACLCDNAYACLLAHCSFASWAYRDTILPSGPPKQI